MRKVLVKLKKQQKTNKTKLVLERRKDIAPLMGVNWLKHLTITINQISLGRNSHHSKQIDIIHTNKNAAVKTQMKRCYPEEKVDQFPTL